MSFLFSLNLSRCIKIQYKLINNHRSLTQPSHSLSLLQKLLGQALQDAIGPQQESSLRRAEHKYLGKVRTKAR